MYAINHLPTIDMSKSTTGCCARFEPKNWDEQVFVFDNKPFVKVKTNSIMHVPLNMGSVMKKTQAMIEDAGAEADENIMLSYEASPWKAEHYLTTTKDVPGLESVKLSGKFITKVFEGPFKDMAKWHKQLIEYVTSKGMTPVKTYFYYTTCPKCSKVYGENYVVGFEQVEEK